MLTGTSKTPTRSDTHIGMSGDARTCTGAHDMSTHVKVNEVSPRCATLLYKIAKL